MRTRRLRKTQAHLEITAFINLIVVLVPFLLSTAVFTRLTVIDMRLPAQSTGAVEKLQAEHLQLEVVIRPEAIEVGDRIGGLIERIPATSTGPDVHALTALAQALKARYPDQRDASVLPEPNTPYDTLVQVMDALRSARPTQAGTSATRTELFPDIAIGDAPLVKRQGR